MQGASSGLRWLQSSRLGWRRSKAWVGWRTGRAWESLGILASWQVKASSCLQRSGCLVRCQLSPGLGKVTTFTIQIVEFALFSGRFIWLLSVLVDEVFYYTSRHEKSCLMEEHTDRQSRHSRPDWGLHQLWQDSSREDWLQWVQEALGGHVVFGIFWSRMEFRALPRWSYELAALSSKIDLRGAIGSFVIWSHLSGERWFYWRLVACWLVRRSSSKYWCGCAWRPSRVLGSFPLHNDPLSVLSSFEVFTPFSRVSNTFQSAHTRLAAVESSYFVFPIYRTAPIQYRRRRVLPVLTILPDHDTWPIGRPGWC